MGRVPASAKSKSDAALIGGLVRKIRKSKKLTLDQLSELTGIAASSLSRIENTRLGLTVEKIRILADALEITPETLLTPVEPESIIGAELARSSLSPNSATPSLSVDRARGRVTEVFGDATLHYLFGKSGNKALDCIHFKLEPTNIWDSDFVRHAGEKVAFVLTGAVLAYVEKRSPVVLEKGDAFHMNANVWHSTVAANGAAAELFVVYYHGLPDGAGVFEAQRFTPETWAALQS